MVVPSFKHGIYLFSEKESNALVNSGTITDITNTYGNNKFTYENKHSIASSYVYIDGEKYYIMYIGDFNVGDEVKFEYLPKSKVILSIYYADDAQ
jgi:mRNA degradation ribonuclease J1/J2